MVNYCDALKSRKLVYYKNLLEITNKEAKNTVKLWKFYKGPLDSLVWFREIKYTKYHMSGLNMTVWYGCHHHWFMVVVVVIFVIVFRKRLE